MRGAHLKHSLHFLGRAREDDDVRRVRPVAAPDPHEVGEALAARVFDAGRAVVADVRSADDLLDGRPCGSGQRRLRKDDLVKGDRQVWLAETAGSDLSLEEVPRVGRQGMPLGRVSPAVPDRAGNRPGQVVAHVLH